MYKMVLLAMGFGATWLWALSEGADQAKWFQVAVLLDLALIHYYVSQGKS